MTLHLTGRHDGFSRHHVPCGRPASERSRYAAAMRTSKRFALNVDRDSVCAGDDIDAPHAKRFAFHTKDTLEEALSAIVEARYLANIAGGKATWIVEAAGKAVAVVAQQWKSPKFLIDPTTLVIECTTPKAPRALFFRYWC